MFISKKTDWETPQDLFDKLNKEFNFDIDVCASYENAKCETYYDEDFNCLDHSWINKLPDENGNFINIPLICFMNPPYGRSIGLFVQKAYIESMRGNTVVCLLPARTDTRWFHTYCFKGEIRFLKGRLKFSGSKQSAPFPSMIVIFRGIKHE